jgi:subtilisin
VLRGKAEILAVEEDVEMHILGFPSEGIESAAATATGQPLWNIQMIKAPQAWARNVNGVGINLAILDTGIAAHPDLVISGGISMVPGVPSYNDGHGHGTHCAGIAAARNGLNNVYGVAPQSNLYAVKVLSDAGSGQSSWIIAGMSWCISNNIKVASMSLGGANPPYMAYAQAIKNCQDNGVTVVCAAGNSYGTNFPWVCSPANSVITGFPNASPIAVAAVDSNSNIAPFSSRGGQTAPWNQVVVAAPGVNVYSTYLNGGYTTMSGTSMACPHVSGLAALICQKYPGISPQMVEAKISATAKNLGTAPYPNIPYGYGLIDCDSSIR